MIAPSEALAAVIATVGAPIGETELVPLVSSTGRVTAAKVRAAYPVPRFDHAAVDGYGLDAAAYCGRRLNVMSSVAAGQDAGAALSIGSAVRLCTGAPIPGGVTAVVMHETCRLLDGALVVDGAVADGLNVRRRGEDIACGDVLVKPGTLMGANQVAALAAAGITHISVARALRVAVLSTGNELRPLGSQLAPFETYDANRPMLMACLQKPWIEVVDGGILSDDRILLADALAALSLQVDVIIGSGGAGGSEADHIAHAVEIAGGAARSLRIAQRPGKPLVIGCLNDVPVLGLPGNTAAAMVNFTLYGEPLLSARTGLRHQSPISEMAVLNARVDHPAGRTDYLPASICRDTSDRPLVVEPLRGSGPASLYALLQADGIVEVPPTEGIVEAGRQVSFHRFHRIFAG